MIFIYLEIHFSRLGFNYDKTGNRSKDRIRAVRGSGSNTTRPHGKTNFSYLISGSTDPLNRLQTISYNTSSANATYTISSVPTVTFEYMTTGDQTRVKKVYDSTNFTEENSFDSWSRVSQYKLTMASRFSYAFRTGVK